jgi:hypothetical protein
MRLLARVDFSKASMKVTEEHLEWYYILHARELQRHTRGLVLVCLIAGYYQERIFVYLDEVVRWYLSDGFFIEWTTMNEEDHYYNACQTRWCNYSGGLKLPKGPQNTN